ncbi:MAG TPA: hypothetical protein VH599_04645 [Ktedonobacterales bacterium]
MRSSIRASAALSRRPGGAPLAAERYEEQHSRVRSIEPPGRRRSARSVSALSQPECRPKGVDL